MLIVDGKMYPLDRCVLLGGAYVWVKPLQRVVSGDEYEISFSEVRYV